jgi:hypothetical protein
MLASSASECSLAQRLSVQYNLQALHGMNSWLAVPAEISAWDGVGTLSSEILR